MFPFHWQNKKHRRETFGHVSMSRLLHAYLELSSTWWLNVYGGWDALCVWCIGVGDEGGFTIYVGGRERHEKRWWCFKVQGWCWFLHDGGCVEVKWMTIVDMCSDRASWWLDAFTVYYCFRDRQKLYGVVRDCWSACRQMWSLVSCSCGSYGKGERHCGVLLWKFEMKNAIWCREFLVVLNSVLCIRRGKKKNLREMWVLYASLMCYGNWRRRK